jgi:hypothetical protein
VPDMQRCVGGKSCEKSRPASANTACRIKSQCCDQSDLKHNIAVRACGMIFRILFKIHGKPPSGPPAAMNLLKSMGSIWLG